MLVGIFFIWLVLVPPVLADDFILNSDGSVVDLESGLIWFGRSSQADTGSEAVEYCFEVPEADQSLWRLPTRSELSNLERHLFATSPSIYWATDDSMGRQGLYCLSDGAFFRSHAFKTAGLVRCVTENPLAPVLEAIKAWADSWQNGDIQSYLASYIDDFKPHYGNTGHEAWKDQRRQRLENAGEISIRLQTREIKPLNDQLVEVLFQQNYHSSRYSDLVDKRLILSLQQGKWLIAREEQLASLPQKALPVAASF